LNTKKFGQLSEYTLSMANPVTVTKNPGVNTTYYNPALTLNMIQPLIQGSGREIVESTLNQAINTEKSTEIAYKAAIMIKITQVINDYWAVVSAEASLLFAREALKDAHLTVKENKERIKLGFMAPSENVQAESSVASQEVQVASTEYTLLSAKNTLLKDIGLSPATPVTVNKTISVEKANYPKGDEAKRILFANNTEYLIALNSLKNSKISLLQAEDKQRWMLNLTATATQGEGSGGNGNDNLTSLYNGRNSNRGLGLQLVVPIDNMPLQQQLVAAKVAYTQQQLAVQDLRLTLEANLISSLENLRILFMQVNLAQNAQRLANQSYHDALKKIQFGQSSMFEVTSLQLTYISNNQTMINTEIAYLNAVAQYQNLLGITLDKQGVNLTY
jgi:outer membrane protein TolC